MKKHLNSIGSFIGYLAISYGLELLTSDSAMGGIEIWENTGSVRYLLYTWIFLGYLLFGVITILYTWYRINSRNSSQIIDLGIFLLSMPAIVVGWSGFIPFGFFYQASIFSALLSIISFFHLNEHEHPSSLKPTKSTVKKGFLYFGLVILALIALAFIFRDSVKIIVADVLWDNKIHNYTCEELPDLEDVRQTLEDNEDFVEQIKNVNPESIQVGPGKIDECPDKADIHIYFGGHSDRETIEEMIESELLFGIPYRMTNY